MIKFFRNRSLESELMDSEKISFKEFHACLKELEIINIFTLAYLPTLNWLKRLTKQNKFKRLTLLDIGSGGGDMLRKISTWSKKNDVEISLIGVDINPWAKQSAEILSPNSAINYITTDIFSIDPEYKVDLITSSLFTHHLNDELLIKFIIWMDDHAKRGWFINDLHRHFLPYYFIKYIVRIFSRNRLIKNDAPLSVAKAFTYKDWQILLKAAGVPEDKISIKWHFPFRYSVTRHK